jgi:undecaprenyl-diphosphatase
MYGTLTIMPAFQAIVLALVQALTEFLPVSSSGHLAMVPILLNWPDQGLTFDVALHIGTLLAVLGYFFRDLVQVTAQAFGIQYGNDEELRQQPKLLWWMLLASVPTATVGLLAKDFIEEHFRNSWVIAFMLISVGLLMWWGERRGSQRKSIATMTLQDALLIGLSQAVALVPGTSRSGITITTGLFCGVSRSAAARFSFLLSTPAVGGAGMKALYDLYRQGGLSTDTMMSFLLGISVSAVAGAFVIAFFLRWIRSNSLQVFVWYRILFGILVITLAIFRHKAA